MILSSPTSHQKSRALAWYRRADTVAWRLNFHHLLARAVPKLFVLLVLLALFDLFRREAALPSRWSDALLLLGTSVVLAWSWLQARRHFCTSKQAMERLETVLNLHNQLSAAEAGIVPWPVMEQKVDDGYAVNWKQVSLPVLAGTLFLWCAHLIPISGVKSGASSGAISEPPEYAQVQNWINALKADDLIEPAKLQDMQSSLDKLRQRPAQDWYTQSNLEAANSLKELTEQAMNSLSQELAQADQTVQAMRDQAASGSDSSTLQAMQDKLNLAAENLASGNLPLNRELVSKMRNGDAAMDKPLSAGQLAALHEMLKKGALTAQTASKINGGMSQEMKEAMAVAALMQGTGRREMRPGAGGLGGGKQSAPLELQARDKTTPEGPLTAVSNEDMSHVALGETIKISASKPNADPAQFHGNQNAGAAQVTGSGGEAVWRSTYDPQEADTLDRFFK